MKIELLHDYYIDVSPKGYTLKKRYISEKKTGEKVTREKGCGFYSNLHGALDAFCRMNQDSEFGDLHTYFADYAYRVEKSNHKTVEELKKLIESGGVLKWIGNCLETDLDTQTPPLIGQ